MRLLDRVLDVLSPPDPLDPLRYDSWGQWIDALLRAGVDTDDVHRRVITEKERQHRLAFEAERRDRARDLAERTAEGRAAASERILREAGLW
jgi:hypothetical protein